MDCEALGQVEASLGVLLVAIRVRLLRRYGHRHDIHHRRGVLLHRLHHLSCRIGGIHTHGSQLLTRLLELDLRVRHLDRHLRLLDTRHCQLRLRLCHSLLGHHRHFLRLCLHVLYRCPIGTLFCRCLGRPQCQLGCHQRGTRHADNRLLSIGALSTLGTARARRAHRARRAFYQALYEALACISSPGSPGSSHSGPGHGAACRCCRAICRSGVGRVAGSSAQRRARDRTHQRLGDYILRHLRSHRTKSA